MFIEPSILFESSVLPDNLKSKEPDVQFYCYIIIIFIHINVQFVALKCFR